MIKTKILLFVNNFCMNKCEFVDIVAKKTCLDKNQVEDMLKVSFDVICKTLRQNEEVCFRGFGKFFVKTSGERVCYNNFCNKKVLVAGKNTPHLKIFKNFKEIIK